MSVFFSYFQSQIFNNNHILVSCVASILSPERDEALARFYSDAKGNALVLNKWFAIQAMADYPNLLDAVKALKTHPDFTLTNPNRARSLISTFCANLPNFHAIDGEGYRFVADSVLELDRLNPQVAARMVSVFTSWSKFDEIRKLKMKAELQRVLGDSKLSSDTFEVVTRCLS
jgi:aminopeptidase N